MSKRGRILTPLLLLTLCGCRVDCFVRQISIDEGLHVRPSWLTFPLEPQAGSYFYVSSMMQGVAYDHMLSEPGHRRVRELEIETRSDGSLDRMVRTERLVVEPFGEIDSVRQCYFKQTSLGGNSSVIVSANHDENTNETPAQVPGRPVDLPALTSLSLVRVFGVGAHSTIVAANYEADGRIGSFSEANETAGNFWLQPQVLERLKPFGMPVSLTAWVQTPGATLPLAKTALPELATYLVRHFGYDQVIELDELRDAAIVSPRYLKPSVTVEEGTLNPLCTAKFEEQRARGGNTVF